MQSTVHSHVRAVDCHRGLREHAENRWASAISASSAVNGSGHWTAPVKLLGWPCPRRARPCASPISARPTRTSSPSTASISTCRAGQCFGLLGPNGAGKTTTIEICEGLTEPDSGDVEVLGLRWASDAQALRQRLGIQLQETQLSDKLTVCETLRLFRSFFDRGPAPDEVIALVQLEEKRDARVGRALGRTEAAAGARVRARRRSGPALSRRADHRPRPAGAAAVVGPHRGVQEGGPDDPADDPLHGRSRAALRPSGDHGPRQGHRARHAGASSSRRSAPTTSSSSRRPAASGRRSGRRAARRRACATRAPRTAASAFRRPSCTAPVPALLEELRRQGMPLTELQHALGDAGGRVRLADGTAPAR